MLWHCWFGHLACKNRPRNDLLCVDWDVKPYTLTLTLAGCFSFTEVLASVERKRLQAKPVCLLHTDYIDFSKQWILQLLFGLTRRVWRELPLLEMKHKGCQSKIYFRVKWLEVRFSTVLNDVVRLNWRQLVTFFGYNTKLRQLHRMQDQCSLNSPFSNVLYIPLTLDMTTLIRKCITIFDSASLDDAEHFSWLHPFVWMCTDFANSSIYFVIYFQL